MANKRIIYVLSTLWGAAEATFFFIVPDVLLSWVAISNLRVALRACLWAVAGSLVGGAGIWWIGNTDPDLLRPVFEAIPAISPAMIDRVREQLLDYGAAALFIGPTIGTPYKIYALEAAGAGVGLIVFAVTSVPARLLRFAAVTLLAAYVGRLLRRHLELRTIYALHIILWVGFYSWYFSVMP